MAQASSITGRSFTANKPEALLAGARTDISGKPIKNVILLSLPDNEFKLLRPHLEPTALPQYMILEEAGEKIQTAYFLNDGMTSLVASASDGRSVEVGLVGREGMVGMPVTVGMKTGSFRAIMQIAGAGLRVQSMILEQALLAAPQLRDDLSRYAMVRGMQTAQLVACNRLHDIDQRLARWLLMCQDRVDAPELCLTHEFLAQMLGSGRPSVTLAAGTLETAGIIENHRGTVRILNRKNLEDAACECYRVIQNFNGGLGLR